MTEAQAEEKGRKAASTPVTSSEPPSRAIPRLSSDTVVDRAFQTAADAMGNLHDHAHRLEDILPKGASDAGPTRRGATLGEFFQHRRVEPRPAPAELESDFNIAARGHRVPEEVVSESDFSAIPYLQPLDDSRISSYASGIIGSWLPSIVGSDIIAQMNNTPAVLCAFTEPEHMTGAQIFAELQMIGALGAYATGSNAIIFPPEISTFSEADARHVVLHEELHYASYLGGGASVRWRDEGGNPVLFSPRSQSMGFTWSTQEGLTELTSQEILRERGFVPSMIGYPSEVITCYYMEQLLGEGGRDILRSAYLSGDFTEVRRRVDAVLGAGTFDHLMFRRDGADALQFLLGRMDERGIDHSQWDASPIVSAARAKLAEAH